MSIETTPDRDWLPPSIVAAHFPRATLDALIGDWWQGWVADRPAPSLEWAIRGEGRTGVAADAGARGALADLILARRPQAVVTAEDRRILDAVAGAAIDDLSARIAGAFPAAAPSPLWRAELRVGGDAIVIAIEEAAMVRAIRAGSRGDAAALPPLADALAAVAFDASLHLGSCRLSLRDVAGCEPGDVLMLDRGGDAAMALAIERRPHGDLACRLSPVDGGFHAILS